MNPEENRAEVDLEDTAARMRLAEAERDRYREALDRICDLGDQIAHEAVNPSPESMKPMGGYMGATMDKRPWRCGECADLRDKLLAEAAKAQKWADHYAGENIEHVAKSSYYQGRANAFREAARVYLF